MNDSSGGGLSEKEARRAMTRKYATIRGLLGSYRRTPLGVDRDGREYFVLGEQWSRIFVCAPPPKDKLALMNGDGDGDDEGAFGDGDGDGAEG